MVDEARLHSPIGSSGEALVLRRAVGGAVEKNQAHSVDQCWL